MSNIEYITGAFISSLVTRDFDLNISPSKTLNNGKLYSLECFYPYPSIYIAEHTPTSDDTEIWSSNRCEEWISSNKLADKIKYFPS